MVSRLSLESSARRPSLPGASRPVLRRNVTRTWRTCQHRLKRHRQRNSKQFKNFSREFTLILDKRDDIGFITDISQKNLFGRFRQDFRNKFGDAGCKTFIIVIWRQRYGGCQKKRKHKCKFLFKFKPQQLLNCQKKHNLGCKLLFKPKQLRIRKQKLRHKLIFKPQRCKFDIKFFQKGDLQQAVLRQRLRRLFQQEFLKFIIPQRLFDRQFPEFRLLQLAVIDPQQFKLLIQQELLKFIVPQQRFVRRQPFFRRRSKEEIAQDQLA